MKYIYRIATIVLAASALLLTSCAKEKVVGIAGGELVECTLQADVIGTGSSLDIDTKVALDGETPNWETGDQILVLDADKKPLGTDGIFTLSSGAGTASGKFTGTVYVGQKAAYAIYPASAGTVNSTNPAATAVTAGTLAAPTDDDAGTIKAAVMLGTSSDGAVMAFTNACAVLKFNTGDYGKSGGDPAIKSVKVSASCSSTPAPLAGNFNINWTATPPTIAPAGSGTVNELTVTLPSALQANDKNVFIPIFPLPMQSTTAPSMKYVFTNTEDDRAEIEHDFSDAITGGVIKILGTMQGMEFLYDPEHWVSMGLVSADGYPLYISKYNVSSISSTGEVTFANSIDGGSSFTYSSKFASLNPDNLTYDGKTVHMMHMGEAVSLLNPDYYTFDVTNSNDFTIKRKGGSGQQLRFISSAGRFSLYRDAGLGVHDGGSDIYVDYTNSSGSGFIKVVYEDRRDSKKVQLAANGENIYYTYNAYAASRELNASQPTQPKKIGWGTEQLVHTAEAWIYTFIGFDFEDRPTMYFYEVPNSYSMKLTNVEKKSTGSSKDVELVHTFIHISGMSPFGHLSHLHGYLVFNSSKWTEDSKYIVWENKPIPCFLSGTLITLADGSKKPIEEITYEDELKVWNFDKGCYDSAKVLWLTKKGLKNDHYVKCTFSDGTVLNVTGQGGHHKLYNYTDRFFQAASDIELGNEIFTENGVVTLVSREWVDEEVEYYNLMTDKHINCFADGVLTSSRFNNSYPVDENMKFVNDGRKIRPYVMFWMYGISREWYDGLRLGEQEYKLKTMKGFVERYESYMREKPQEEQPGFFVRICNWFKNLFRK